MHHEMATPDAVTAAHAGGKSVHAFTANTPAMMRQVGFDTAPQETQSVAGCFWHSHCCIHKTWRTCISSRIRPDVCLVM